MKKLLLAVVALIIVLPATGGFSPVSAAAIPLAQPDKGLVVFFREKKAKGSALRFQISDGTGKELGGLANGTTFHVWREQEENKS